MDNFIKEIKQLKWIDKDILKNIISFEKFLIEEDNKSLIYIYEQNITIFYKIKNTLAKIDWITKKQTNNFLVSIITSISIDINKKNLKKCLKKNKIISNDLSEILENSPLLLVEQLKSNLESFYSFFNTKDTTDKVKEYQKLQLENCKKTKTIVNNLLYWKPINLDIITNMKLFNMNFTKVVKEFNKKNDINSFIKIALLLVKSIDKEIKRIKDKLYYIEIVSDIREWKGDRFEELYLKINPIIEKHARKYSYWNKEIFDDLHQSASISILKGIQNYSVEKSDNFINYIKTRIIQWIFNYLTNKESTIRLPVHIKQILNKIYNLMSDYTFMEKVDESDLNKELAKELNEDVSVIDKALRYLNENNVVNFTALEWENTEWDKISFENTLWDIWMDLSSNIIESEEVETLRKIITSVLTEEEQKILVYRYGLFWHNQLLLKDLWKKLNKSEERIRQIEGRVLNKLSIKYFDKNFVNNFCHS